MKTPNLLLTIADDQRHSALGACREVTADAVKTPSLDGLARRGTHFTHAYHAGSYCGAVCLPSRAMLHSGCDRQAIPRDLGGAAHDCPPLLGEQLQQCGYHAHGIGKWHNGGGSFSRSFSTGQSVFLGGMCDIWNVPLHQWDGKELRSAGMQLGCHSTDVFVESAVDFLYDYADGVYGDRPFFLYVAFTAPHDPRQTHRHFHERYHPDEVVLPPNFAEMPQFSRHARNGRDELLTPLPRSESLIRQHMADYYACVEHMDQGLGRIYAVLDELGLNDSTLVAHTADHGIAIGQHGLMGKQSVYDHSIRVPLIVAGPGVSRGHTTDNLVYQHDLYPTLLEAAHARLPTHTPYRSLSTSLAGQQSGHEHVISYFRDTHFAVTNGRHKLEKRSAPFPAALTWYELDLDPWECNGTSIDVDALNTDQHSLLRVLRQQFPCKDVDATILKSMEDLARDMNSAHVSP